jgi:hypothetical protein
MVTTNVRSKQPGSWFGTILELTGDHLTLKAHFRTGEKEKVLRFDRAELDWIEFNLSTMNDGAPPESLGVQPREKGERQPKREQEADGDLIVLPLGGRDRCQVTAIDSSLVKCSAKSFPRADVVRVVFHR